MNRKVLIGLAAALALGIAIGGPLAATFTDKTMPEQLIAPSDATSAAAQRFLERYAQPDGRVARLDEGNDTVSEGQAYAMLIAVATGDRARFDSVWNWSKVNLKQPNGLLAWKWSRGRVVDSQSATDADMDAARALSVASKRFGDLRYADEGRALAKAIADNDIVYPSDGQPVLAAGPWVKSAPFYVNPSYHSPRAEQELGILSDDRRWPSVAQRQRTLVGQLVDGPGDNVRLPPDWAFVDQAGSIRPTGSPGGENPPQYSYDAVRLPIRLAESCDPLDRQQASKIWTLLNRSQESRTSPKMNLDGSVEKRGPSAVAAVASAGAAHAAGDDLQMLQLLDAAERIERNDNTYYGSAWVALGRVMLTTTWLGTC